MSVSLSVKAFAGKNSDEFKKHFRAVEFCVENDLSFPVETSEFFKGKIDEMDLEEIKIEYVLDYIKDGVEIPLPTTGDEWEIKILTADIPSEVDEIIIKLS